MSGVKAWLNAELERVGQLPCLEDALLGFRAHRYAVYRLRYVFVQSVLRTLFRLLELALFMRAVPFEILSSVLVFRSCMVLMEGLWWGALETLRRDVRELFRKGRLGQASERIGQWRAVAALLGVVVVGLGSLWVWLGPSPFQSFSVVDAFLLGCCVRFAIDVWVTAYHAGVYGIRRVYRPVWSLMLVDIADVTLLVLAYWQLGMWGVGGSLVAVGLLRAVVAWWFTRRVYEELKLVVRAPVKWFKVLRHKARWDLRHSLEHAVSNVIAHVDALFVLGLLAAPGSTRGTVLLAGLFHVVAPLQAAASAWCRLFYFDFKRLEGWGAPLLLRRFEAFLSRASWWMPVPIGLVTLGLMAAFWRGPYWLLALELTLLAAVRARLSLVHIRAYSLSDHRFLLRLCGAMVAIAAITPFLANLEPEVALGAVVALMALGLTVVGRSQTPLAVRSSGGVVEISVWLDQLVRARGSVGLGLARVDRRLSTIGRLGRALRESLGEEALLARVSNDTLVWYAPEVASAQTVLTAAAGTIRELGFAAPATNGKQAFMNGVEGATWQRVFGAALVAARLDTRQGLAELEQELLTVHPQLKVLPLQSPASLPVFDVAVSRDMRRLLLDAARGHTGFRALGEYDVTVLAPAGNPTALIVAPRNARPAAEWKGAVSAIVQRANLVWTVTRHTVE